jgi:cytochrome P450
VTPPPTLDPFALPDTIQFGVEDPYPALAEARKTGEVVTGFALVPEGEMSLGDDAEEVWFSVFGYDEVRTVLRDNDTFSSLILADMMGPIIGRTIVALDEPEHGAHRALVAPAFRTKLLARWEHELVERVVHELIDSFAADGRADLVRQFTFAFPVRVIARILGLPDRDMVKFQRWSMELISAPVNWDRAVAASETLRAYFAEIVTERRRAPQDDLISELLEAEIDGERLTDDEVFAFLRLLLPAGVETTYRSSGNLLFALLMHTDQFDAVRRDPELRVAAIEEGLRWESPFLLVARRAVRDTQVGGVDIPAGATVEVYVGAANRDGRHYDDPDRFDVHRFHRSPAQAPAPPENERQSRRSPAPKPHLTFGFGPHVCLGMHLARMESRVALDAVIERLPDLRIDPDAPAPRIIGSIMRSPDSLLVRFG